MSLALEDLIVPFDSRYKARPVHGSRQESIDVRRGCAQCNITKPHDPADFQVRACKRAIVDA